MEGDQQVETEEKASKPKIKSRRRNGADDANKRRCVSTAYHRRKGVYKKEIDHLKTTESTLHTLIQAILNYPEDEVTALVKQIRTCESLDDVAESILVQGLVPSEAQDEKIPEMPDATASGMPTFETRLSGRMGEMRLDDGSVRYLGGTSNLIHLGLTEGDEPSLPTEEYQQQENPCISWTGVTNDAVLVRHLIDMYFTWHYTYFCCLSRASFFREFWRGRPPPGTRRTVEYCTPLLVNAMLALGCHFTSHPGAREDPSDSATAGDHFFKEAKRLFLENDEYENPKLTSVQALALMSVREAGCGREAKGWFYSGMSFRMACDLGLNLNSGALSSAQPTNPDDEEEDARRATFWGCFLFDKCWSNYLGRTPQLPNSIVTVPKFEVFPNEDAEQWAPYSDSGFSQAHAQPARTRAVALQISALCEISNDLMNFFYNPQDMGKSKGKQAEIKKLSEIHTRLEAWRKNLPKEMEPKEGTLSSVLVMHMFFHLLFIHTFRPFLKYNPTTSPLPANVSPRKICTQAAAMISKLLRLYKRSYGLRQICNVAVYIAHSACTIHLLNLPDKNANRDIIHGLKHLEEIAEGWLCARRTLAILSKLSRKWNVDLPEEARTVLDRTDDKYGPYRGSDASPKATGPNIDLSDEPTTQQQLEKPSPPTMVDQASYFYPNGSAFLDDTQRTNSGTSLPPRSAQDLVYPPRGVTAGSVASTSPAQPRRSMDSSTGLVSSSMASPTSMFGGMEQLIREGQDWALRDQQNLALGFGNWDTTVWPDMSWVNDGSNGATSVPTASNASMHAPIATGTAPGPEMNVTGPNGVNGMTMMNPMNGANGANGVNGMNGMNWARTHGYIDNESDWYT
ncbi:MAG: hypothetical protein M1821_000865 [Bathelium mastoideum]|nr:MAG: hypothetical protein M1821_000865 [Bathelium mastoideum]